jgi:hypothetical protein
LTNGPGFATIEAYVNKTGAEMKELKAFVEQENRFAALFKGKPLNLNNAIDRQKIAERIDSRLSPENLSCDGELSRAQVNAKYRNLTRCAEQLLKLDPSVKFYEFA